MNNMDNESGRTGIIIFGVGTLVGAFTAFLILKGRQQPAPAAVAQQPQSMDMSAELPRLHAEIHRLRIENDELRLKLQIAAPKGPVVTGQASPQSLSLQKSQIPAVPVTEASLITYKNIEKWKYEKDKIGRITGLEISREAKRNA